MAPDRDFYVCPMNFTDHAFLHYNPEGSGHFYFLRRHKLNIIFFNWIPDMNNICALGFHWALSPRGLWEAWESSRGIIHPSRASQSGGATHRVAASSYWRGHLLFWWPTSSHISIPPGASNHILSPLFCPKAVVVLPTVTDPAELYHSLRPCCHKTFLMPLKTSPLLSVPQTPNLNLLDSFFVFPGDSVGRNPLAKKETLTWSPGRKDPLEKETAAHSSILAWRSPWIEEPGGHSPGCHKRVDMTKRLSTAHAPLGTQMDSLTYY